MIAGQQMTLYRVVTRRFEELNTYRYRAAGIRRLDVNGDVGVLIVLITLRHLGTAPGAL